MAAGKNSGLVKNTAGSGLQPKGGIFKKKIEKKANNNLSFKNRKDCIKKKTMELSVLCDVKACAVIIGPDGKLETWPENSSDVIELIRAFQKSGSKVSIPARNLVKKTEKHQAVSVEKHLGILENQKIQALSCSEEIEDQRRLTLNQYQEQGEFGSFLSMLNDDDQEEEGEFASMLEDQLLAYEQPSPSVHEKREQGRVTLYQGHQELASFSASLNVDEKETDFAAMLEDQLLADEESSSPSVCEQEEQPMILSQSEQPQNCDDQEIGTVEDSNFPREKQLEFPMVKVDDEELEFDGKWFNLEPLEFSWSSFDQQTPMENNLQIDDWLIGCLPVFNMDMV
ncbi:OLC1v1018951C1 [Oldenlandia corymbosa var. corymbosa]|uniref:OLC1v1018951C1 n=1 Tax=Oldenlandia corymbosa var. corymbosa TaxID=529605 RepID=A0AAV1ECY1_OLDCO|nr:OLC1v1018951C1 [Oldenlandia corymbosa var. corymbosa]